MQKPPKIGVYTNPGGISACSKARSNDQSKPFRPMSFPFALYGTPVFFVKVFVWILGF